jgi:hypothetical protein
VLTAAGDRHESATRKTRLVVLVVENFILAKSEQPHAPKDDSWKKEFELD